MQIQERGEVDSGDVIFQEHVEAGLRRYTSLARLDPMRKEGFVDPVNDHGRQIRAQDTIACKKRNNNVLKYVNMCGE